MKATARRVAKKHLFFGSPEKGSNYQYFGVFIAMSGPDINFIFSGLPVKLCEFLSRGNGITVSSVMDSYYLAGPIFLCVTLITYFLSRGQ